MQLPPCLSACVHRRTRQPLTPFPHLVAPAPTLLVRLRAKAYTPATRSVFHQGTPGTHPHPACLPVYTVCAHVRASIHTTHSLPSLWHSCVPHPLAPTSNLPACALTQLLDWEMARRGSERRDVDQLMDNLWVQLQVRGVRVNGRGRGLGGLGWKAGEEGRVQLQVRGPRTGRDG